MKSHARHRAVSTFFSLLLGASLWPSASGAVIHNMSEAVDMSGSQSMLTQRMVRDYALVGMNIEYHHPEQDLKKSLARFSAQLADLQSYKINAGVSAAVAEVVAAWRPVKPILEAKPALNQAAKLYAAMEKVLEASQKVATLIATASATHVGETVNLAGRQRMLAQRMAALYMLRAWRVKQIDYLKEFQLAVSEFKSAQGQLEKSTLNTPEISAELASTRRSFLWFELGSRQTHGEDEHFTPALILRASDRIVQHMNKATALYTQRGN